MFLSVKEVPFYSQTHVRPYVASHPAWRAKSQVLLVRSNISRYIRFGLAQLDLDLILMPFLRFVKVSFLIFTEGMTLFSPNG